MVAVNYKDCLQIKGVVPVTIVIGDRNLGKSCAAKCVLSLIGRPQAFYRRISEAMQTRVLNECTMPFVLDDAGRTTEEKRKLIDLLLNTFNGGSVANYMRLSKSTTSPVITMNDYVLADLNTDKA